MKNNHKTFRGSLFKTFIIGSMVVLTLANKKAFSQCVVPVVVTTINETCVKNNGAVTAMANGTAPYLYSWSNSFIGSTINNLSAGTYTVTVSDYNGCSNTAAATVLYTGNPVISVAVTPATCGSNNGAATASVKSGGTPQYTYSWNTGTVAPNLSGMQAGNYTLTVVDATGCTSQTTITINCVTGVKENTNSMFMNISPNPSNGSFVIETKFEKAGRAIISLTNILGETVMLIDNIEQAGVYKKEVDIKQLTEGIYFLVIQQNNERILKRIVLQ